MSGGRRRTTNEKGWSEVWSEPRQTAPGSSSILPTIQLSPAANYQGVTADGNILYRGGDALCSRHHPDLIPSRAAQERSRGASRDPSINRMRSATVPGTGTLAPA